MNTRPSHVASWCLSLAVAAALAPPTTTLAEPPTGGFPGGGPKGGSRGGPGGIGWSEMNKEQKEQFFAELRAFCTEHSPNRWKEIETRMQQRGVGGLSNMDHMARRFRELQMLEKFDPELHGIKVRQLEVEDAEYALLAEIKRIKDASPVDEPRLAKLKEKLQEQSKDYVGLRLQERSHRINWLNRELDKEKKRLGDDQAIMDRLVATRVGELEKQGPNFFFRDWRRRPTTGPTTAPPPQRQPSSPK